MIDPAILPTTLPASEGPVFVPPTRGRTAPMPDQVIDRALTTLDQAQAALDEATRDGAATGRRKKKRLAVSVVIPVYNERRTIREIVARVRAAGRHDEIVIVDDCSTDGTRDILIELAESPDVQVHMHGYNKGKGAALRTALEQVHGDVVLIQDADLEYDPADYDRLLAPIERGEADVVFGSRFLEKPEQDPSWFHRLGNRLLTSVSNATTGLSLTDMETCYKVFRRDVLRGVTLRERRFGFEPEFTAKVARYGCVVREVPVRYHSRNYSAGKKIGVRDALAALWCILRYAWAD
jgi:glycosyltransferase involved in cell wall biosynthesis